MGEGGGTEFPPKLSTHPPQAAEAMAAGGGDAPVSAAAGGKKLARQLDFNQGSVVLLPEHPQSHQPQQPQQQQQQQQQQQVQQQQVPTQKPPVAVAMTVAAGAGPVAIAPKILPVTHPAAVVSRSHPQVPAVTAAMSTTQTSPLQMQQQPPARLVPESPKARPRSSVELKDGTPKKQKQCNCKHSRCLKLYCECFASGTYCDGCNCVNCFNNSENEAARREAVEATLERNPNAFRPKIASSPHGSRDNREDTGDGLVFAKHNKGCHCKKSGCLKKYCECFQANILCSENCKCMDCKNFEGSEERQAIIHGDHANNMTYIQQAANAAITGAIGSSGYVSTPVSKKRKGQELMFGSTAKDPSLHRLGPVHQAGQMRPSTPAPSLSSNPAARTGTTALATSKFTYRSLLAGIIQPHDFTELCSVLVVLAGEAAKTVTSRKSATEKKVEDQTETSLALSTQERLQGQKESDADKIVADDSSNANQVDKVCPDDSSSDVADVPKERPISPGTLALMCDEQDTIFMASESPNRLTGQGSNTSCQLPCGEDMTEVYAEQERVILTKFRDCLNRLITFGEIKETQCSSLARTELGNHKDSLSNGSATMNARNENGRQQGPLSNGLAKSVVPPTGKTSQIVSSVVAASGSDVPRTPTLPQNGDDKPKS